MAGVTYMVLGLAMPAAFADASGTDRFDQQMRPLLASYLKIGSTLAADSTKGVGPAAAAITEAAAKLDAKSVTGEHAAHYRDLPANLQKAAQALRKATTLDDARKAFKRLSQPMAMWVTMSKPPDVRVVYCSMDKASWVQKHGDIRNPYFGAKMLSCGEVVGGAADKHESKHGH